MVTALAIIWPATRRRRRSQTGLAALRAGWRLFQASQLNPHYPGVETQTAYLKYEFWFEQIVDVG